MKNKFSGILKKSVSVILSLCVSISGVAFASSEEPIPSIPPDVAKPADELLRIFDSPYVMDGVCEAETLADKLTETISGLKDVTSLFSKKERAMIMFSGDVPGSYCSSRQCMIDKIRPCLRNKVDNIVAFYQPVNGHGGFSEDTICKVAHDMPVLCVAAIVQWAMIMQVDPNKEMIVGSDSGWLLGVLGCVARYLRRYPELYTKLQRMFLSLIQKEFPYGTLPTLRKIAMYSFCSDDKDRDTRSGQSFIHAVRAVGTICAGYDLKFGNNKDLRLIKQGHFCILEQGAIDKGFIESFSWDAIVGKLRSEQAEAARKAAEQQEKARQKADKAEQEKRKKEEAEKKAEQEKARKEAAKAAEEARRRAEQEKAEQEKREKEEQEKARQEAMRAKAESQKKWEKKSADVAAQNRAKKRQERTAAAAKARDDSEERKTTASTYGGVCPGERYTVRYWNDSIKNELGTEDDAEWKTWLENIQEGTVVFETPTLVNFKGFEFFSNASKKALGRRTVYKAKIRDCGRSDGARVVYCVDQDSHTVWILYAGLPFGYKHANLITKRDIGVCDGESARVAQPEDASVKW